MPYKNDPRRTVTLNLLPDEYSALAEDALEAGYLTPGTYALALVRQRGEAPEPIQDHRTEERSTKLLGEKLWLQHQFEALQAQLTAAGLFPRLTPMTGPEPWRRPRSWAAQERAVTQAVAEALAQERARVARVTAKAARQATGPTPQP